MTCQFDHLQAPVFPHPDGKPQAKACPECAFRTSNPQGLSPDDFVWLDLQMAIGGFTFYCNHRLEAGYARECACWAAKVRGDLLKN